MSTRSKAPWFALAVLTGISTVGFIDRIVVNVLVEPIRAEFGLDDAQVSLMGTAYAVLNIALAVIVARYAERAVRMPLIAWGTFLWSCATLACGMAGSWAGLLLARIGVGVGEAVGLPGNQSVVADYFPPTRRGLALSILLLAPPIGAFAGFVGGGWIAQNYDWRFTFLIAAVPGFVLAIIAYLFVAEPARGAHDVAAGDAAGSDDVPPISAVVGRLFGLASARHLVIGSALAAMFGFGLNFFFTSLMMRQFGLGIGEAGLYTGLIASLPSAISVVGSGWLADRLSGKSPAAYALIPAVSMLIGGPIYAFAIMQQDLAWLLALVSIATFLNFGYLGITFAALQNLMHPRMRATASALLNVVYGVAGALGPIVLGWMSASFAASRGEVRGLALAMAVTGLLYLWAAVHYLLAARRLRADIAAISAGTATA